MSKSTQRIKTIAKKEVVEFVRDWRTIVAIIIIPILMFPYYLLYFLFYWNQRRQNLIAKLSTLKFSQINIQLF